MTTPKPKPPSLADPVTHADLQAELNRLREAIVIIASRVAHDLGADDCRRIGDLLRRFDA